MRVGTGATTLVLILYVLFEEISAGCWRNGAQRHEHSESDHYFNHSLPQALEKHQLPKEFDWCDVDGLDLCVSSWNQHIPVYCGSCWVHGALSMVQDRLKIRKKGRGPDTMLARQTLLNCAAFEGMGAGCDGGDVIDVFHYMTKFGLPDESCMTYSATDHTRFNSSLEHCPQAAVCRNCMPLGPKEIETCWAVNTPLLYTLDAFGKVKPSGRHPDNERLMMSEIFHRGPITCSIATPDEFTYGYRAGIWRDRSNSTVKDIDHDVEVVGWGEEDGLEFWRVRNSWGTFWGEMGFFRLERGNDALFIENGDCWYAEPGYEMEREDRAGKLVGSMWGVLKGDTQAPRPTLETHRAT